MGNVLKKNFPCATCLHCGKITDIQLSGDYRSLVSLNKTYCEKLRLEHINQGRIHRCKNSEVQALHKVIAQLRNLMTPEQIEQAKKIHQFMRDELKKAEKEMFKK